MTSLLCSNPITPQNARSDLFILTGMRGCSGGWHSELSIAMACNYSLMAKAELVQMCTETSNLCCPAGGW